MRCAMLRKQWALRPAAVWVINISISETQIRDNINGRWHGSSNGGSECPDTACRCDPGVNSGRVGEKIAKLCSPVEPREFLLQEDFLT